MRIEDTRRPDETGPYGGPRMMLGAIRWFIEKSDLLLMMIQNKILVD